MLYYQCLKSVPDWSEYEQQILYLPALYTDDGTGIIPCLLHGHNGRDPAASSISIPSDRGISRFVRIQETG